MRIRAKLKLMVGTAALAVVAAVIGSSMLGAQQTRRLDDVEDRLVPKLELEPRLEAGLEQLSKTFQEAVSAEDAGALDDALAVKARLFDLITSAGSALSAPNAAKLRWNIQDYYEVARAVSARLIAGETGESIVADIEKMQARRVQLVATVRQVAGLDRSELSAGFAAIRASNRTADRFRLGIGLSALCVLLGLAVWGGRGMLRTLGHLSSGFARFGTGDFGAQIPASSHDELGDVAKEANQMAASLRDLAAERDRNDWIKASVVGLSQSIQGELEPDELSRIALSYLSRRVDAPASGLYLVGDDGALRLSAHHGLAGAEAEDGVRNHAASFLPGEGLLGRAAESQELLRVDEVPEGYFQIRSGLGGSRPRSLWILPLVRHGRTVAVIEFALLAPCSDAQRELLSAIRETLATALEAARSRAVLRRTNDELEAQRRALSQQNADLDDAQTRLQQKAEELTRVSSYKSRFLANMSHELRTPLNSMLILSHLLGKNEGGNLTPKQVLHAKTIHSAGQALLSLINQVLDLAKIESGRQEVHLARVGLGELVAAVRRTFEPLASDKGLRLVTEIAPDLPATMISDRSRVERILTNLLGNAVKFTEHGEVSLRIRRPDTPNPDGSHAGRIAFVVSDTGIGIPLEAHERVFAPFEQAEADASRRDAGTGLGLAISRESAELLGGELTLSSAPGAGTTMTCILPESAGTVSEPVANGVTPALPALPAQVEAVVPDAGSSGEQLPALEHAKVLLAESDMRTVYAISALLTERGMEVLVAENGREALDVLSRHPDVKLVLMDVMISEMDGYEAIRRLRQDGRFAQTPVIALTAKAMNNERERCLAAGATDYLPKPVDGERLLSALGACLTPRGTHAPG